MRIIAKIDPNQNESNPDNLAICPNCKQKLLEIEYVYHKGLLRPKCRRCGKYILVAIIDDENK